LTYVGVILALNIEKGKNKGRLLAKSPFFLAPESLLLGFAGIELLAAPVAGPVTDRRRRVPRRRPLNRTTAVVAFLGCGWTVFSNQRKSGQVNPQLQ
jgi:hypothetical protein